MIDRKVQFNQNNSKNIEVLMSKSNSKGKYSQSNSNFINITVISQNKSSTFKAPKPCPSSTLKQLIESHLHHSNDQISYYLTTNDDWLTDYKIQEGQGWIRGDCELKCVYHKKEHENVSGIEKYSILRCIGVGGFSKVYLVRDKQTGSFYAAKFIEKLRIKEKLELILNQKSVNESVSFPFLVHMQDFIETQLYYVMILDYCPGGELFHLQRKIVRFEEQTAKKYFIEVLLAIQYLHSQEIVYRDLKPENIMLDMKGHIKIADFGLAKKTKNKRYSFCGSLQYMSPEVLARKGHSFEVDFYCMGALLFQMLVGCPPFYEPHSLDTKTQERILFEEVEFPRDSQISEQAKDLIRKLLEKDPKKRLGHFGGTKQIKCHPWIGWLNRQEWLSKMKEMPYPVNLDSFNFDFKDITPSANRMLHNIKAEITNIISNKNRNSFSKKREKSNSPYRIKTRSVNKPKRNLSVDKIGNSPYNNINAFKKVKLNKSNSKQSMTTIKTCYLSHSKLNLSKFLRYPTEIPEFKCKKNKSKQRISYFKTETESKENLPQREKNVKKRRPKQQLIFMRIKRN